MQERMKGLSREVKGKAKSLVLETVQKWMFQESRNYQFCECYLEVMTWGQKRQKQFLWSDGIKPDWNGGIKMGKTV